MTADKCPRTYTQRVAGLLTIIAVAMFAQTFPILAPDSVIVFPKYEPLPDEITRDLDCWVGVWMQECVIVVVRHLPRPPHRAASAALVRACLIHVGGAPTAAVP